MSAQRAGISLGTRMHLCRVIKDMGQYVRFLAHCRLAQTRFHQLNILAPPEFDKVDWEMVYKTLHEVPLMFQQWACKQVMGIAGTMEWDKSVVCKCPSCMQLRNTCAHVLSCNHAGRVETLHHTIDLLESLLEEAGTILSYWTALQSTRMAGVDAQWWRFARALEIHFSKWHGTRMLLAGEDLWRE
jgi:hypothetical protein